MQLACPGLPGHVAAVHVALMTRNACRSCECCLLPTALCHLPFGLCALFSVLCPVPLPCPALPDWNGYFVLLRLWLHLASDKVNERVAALAPGLPPSRPWPMSSPNPSLLRGHSGSPLTTLFQFLSLCQTTGALSRLCIYLLHFRTARLSH